jgi:hypothetical protein
MRLSSKAVITFNGVNSFVTGNQWVIRQGDTNTLYFQLVDLDQSGLRYMAGIGAGNTPASVSVTFPSIDDTKTVVLVATANSSDSSIWSVTMPSTATPSSGQVQFAVTEGSAVRRFNVLNLIAVELLNNGGC